jgi:hypothetical protein
MNPGNVCFLSFLFKNRLLTCIHIKELNQLTGLAAILTFPLDVEVVEAEEKEEAERIQLEKGDELDGG